MAEQWQGSQCVERSLMWRHPSVTDRAAHPQVAVVNSLLSQDAVSPGANSTSSCPSTPLAYFPSPPEKTFTTRVSGMSCSMQAKLGPQHYLSFICNAMTQIWFAGCAVSPPRPNQLAKSLREEAAWQSGKGTPADGHVERSGGWWKKVQKLNPTGCRGRCHPKKTWIEVINMDCLAMDLIETHHSDREGWGGRLRSVVRLDPPLY